MLVTYVRNLRPISHGTLVTVPQPANAGILRSVSWHCSLSPHIAWHGACSIIFGSSLPDFLFCSQAWARVQWFYSGKDVSNVIKSLYVIENKPSQMFFLIGLALAIRRLLASMSESLAIILFLCTTVVYLFFKIVSEYLFSLQILERKVKVKIYKNLENDLELG